MCGVALVTVQTWGIWPSIFLMGLALALTLSQGGFSIGMLICALIAADARGGPTSTTAGGCQLICVAVAAVLCGWCWLRTKLVKPAP